VQRRLRCGMIPTRPRVVKDSEQGNDFDIGSSLVSQAKSVFKDSCPMCNAMITAQRKSVISQNCFQNNGDVEFHVGYFASAFT
jgi:hypothetical protein